ncbi:MAG: FAD-dependent oxidoreductase [Spirochaetales bacterium]|nr:FAD-dependent oxidoreductase [Spirochaetales bacterium]
MNNNINVAIIGGGPAGLAAACTLYEQGICDVHIFEREHVLGGVLFQCIHNGFGIHHFKEELTGPEYAERYIQKVNKTDTFVHTDTAVIDLYRENEALTLVLLGSKEGLQVFTARAVILAMGCRERNRGNINIPGSRPAGIMTAGFAQRMVNLEGYLPGKEIIILGSGDIGLIMARRLSLEGVNVQGVVEIQPFPGGLTRNIVQCLNDFHIPLYLSHTISNIFGKQRIDSVEITAIDNQLEPDTKNRFTLPCDTLLLSVGLVPENELSVKAGVILDEATRGPVVDANCMTTVPGIFACGNVLHVHDIVDYVSEEAARAARTAAQFVNKSLTDKDGIRMLAGNLVRYMLPTKVYTGKPTIVSLRPITPVEDIVLYAKRNGEIVYKKKYQKILPSSMIQFELPALSGIEPVEVFFAGEET